MARAAEVVLLMAERRGLVGELRLGLDRLRELRDGSGPALVLMAETARLLEENERLFARIEAIEEAMNVAGELSCLN